VPRTIPFNPPPLPSPPWPESAPSNAVETLLETRAPRATIVQPASGTVTDAPVTLIATSPDPDIASVQFQYRPTTSSTWTNLGGLVTALDRGGSWFDAIALALGAATANAEMPGAGRLDPVLAAELAARADLSSA
jgi:hypothetical protein